MPARSYHQYCALARALDVVGDRWSLLIVRNLLLGPQRWSELVDGLPGIAKNLLSARLSALVASGVIVRADDGYQLTERGQELERALFALGDWGERHALGPPRAGESIRLRYLMTSIRRRLRPAATAGWLQLHVDDETFSIRVGAAPTVVQGERPATTAVHCDFAGLRALLFERRAPRALAAEGRLGLRGDVALVEAFVGSLPAAGAPVTDAGQGGGGPP